MYSLFQPLVCTSDFNGIQKGTFVCCGYITASEVTIFYGEKHKFISLDAAKENFSPVGVELYQVGVLSEERYNDPIFTSKQEAIEYIIDRQLDTFLAYSLWIAKPFGAFEVTEVYHNEKRFVIDSSWNQSSHEQQGESGLH